ncbi:unnamed protein product [Rangifer tarandus platyrhynchus]|uniref:Uncharacterized protein n=1 Tax=Rangifer tarandus platyrhynchus TaxID=3082113 RepID=A0AC59ZIR0_RANTA
MVSRPGSGRAQTQVAVTPRAYTPRLCSSASGEAGKPLGPGRGRLTLNTGPSSDCLGAAGAAWGVILAALCKDNDVGPANSPRTSVGRLGCWLGKDSQGANTRPCCHEA